MWWIFHERHLSLNLSFFTIFLWIHSHSTKPTFGNVLQCKLLFKSVLKSHVWFHFDSHSNGQIYCYTITHNVVWHDKFDTHKVVYWDFSIFHSIHRYCMSLIHKSVLQMFDIPSSILYCSTALWQMDIQIKTEILCHIFWEKSMLIY